MIQNTAKIKTKYETNFVLKKVMFSDIRKEKYILFTSIPYAYYTHINMRLKNVLDKVCINNTNVCYNLNNIRNFLLEFQK